MARLECVLKIDTEYNRKSQLFLDYYGNIDTKKLQQKKYLLKNL